MRGESIPLSLMRKAVGDILELSQGIPTIPVQRSVNVKDLAEARANSTERPGWTAIFTKAFALVANEYPELRRAYVNSFRPYLRQYPTSVANVAFEKTFQGDLGVLTARVKNPARWPLAKLNRRLKFFATAPVERVHDFRRQLNLTKWPYFLRRFILKAAMNSLRHKRNHFGTFAVSVYSGLGAESLHPLSPVPFVLNYGVIDSNGDVVVRVTYDHRILDGATVARALGRLEQVLQGPILDELRSMTPVLPAFVAEQSL